ncbi:hypothetical protein BGZ83_011866 [Gryganskiella cystojenkinii]|nr:hypothetical protein BGZ83_011866 [Gryganskiella cystojenkinii]
MPESIWPVPLQGSIEAKTEKPAEHKAVTNSEDTTTKYHEALSVYRLFCGKPEKYEGLRSYHIFYKATMISGINSGASWVIRPNVQNLEEGSLLRVGWSSHYQWPFKYEYALSKDDLQKSMAKDPSGFVRIRLPHQVIVNVNTKKLFLDVSADRDKSIRFCSVELHNSLATLNPAVTMLMSGIRSLMSSGSWAFGHR